VTRSVSGPALVLVRLLTRGVVAFAFVGAFASCKKAPNPDSQPTEPVASASASPPPDPFEVAEHRSDAHTPLPFLESTSLASPHLEARRGTSTEAPYKAFFATERAKRELVAQFGEKALTVALEVQEAQMIGARRAILVEAPHGMVLSPEPGAVSGSGSAAAAPAPPGSARRARAPGSASASASAAASAEGGHFRFRRRGGPLLLVTDERGEILWTNPHPFAGIRPGPRGIQATVTGGQAGNVAVVWHDELAHVVALRTWDGEGAILADFRLLDVESCDALSAVYWPGVGHLVATGFEGETQMQLLADNGAQRFGPAGRVLTPRPFTEGHERPSPVRLVVENDAATALYYASAPGKRGDEVDIRAMRFDRKGAFLWKLPVVVGDVVLPKTGRPPAIEAVFTDDDHVAVKLGPKRLVSVTPEGTVLVGAGAELPRGR
jgi:hypothetical protein